MLFFYGNIGAMRKFKLFLIVMLCLTCSGLNAQSVSSESQLILGFWLTGSKKAKVEVYRCGEKYCGKIIWLKEPVYEDGTPKRDKKNPEEKLRNRLINGMNILTDFEYDGDLEWEDGEIYDPENGKTYSCEIYMDEGDKNTLNVRGYIGISLIGRTDIWNRVKTD